MNPRRLEVLGSTVAVALLTLPVVGCGSGEGPLNAAPTPTQNEAGPDAIADAPVQDAAPIDHSPKPVYSEHEFGQDDSLVADPLTTLLFDLEHPDEVNPNVHDSGGQAGVDRIPMWYAAEEEHDFCWAGDPGNDAPHTMTLTTADGAELVRAEEGGDCVHVTVPAGLHTLTLLHGGGRDGRTETIFIRPAAQPPSSEPAPTPGASGMRTMSASRTPTCSFRRQATLASMGLQTGEVALFAEAAPVSTSAAYVFDGACDDLSTIGFLPGSAATGPDTMAMLYHSANFSGALTNISGASSQNVTTTRVAAADAQFTNAHGSVRVWANSSVSTECRVSRAGLVGGDPQTGASISPRAEDVAGRAGTDEIGALHPGEVALYSKPNYEGFAVVLSGSCANLDTICFAGENSHVQSVKLASNMIVTVFAGTLYSGSNFPYNANVATLAPPLGSQWHSVRVETSTVYNSHTTLISTNNCESCYLESAQLQNAHLAGAKLKNADLANADLTAADLHGADLSSAQLLSARMNDVNLENAVASKANFRGAFLNGANLKGAQLDGAFFNADDTHPAAHLDYAYMPNANLKNASLDGASMTYVDLYGTSASVEGATMRNTDLSNAILSDLVFGAVHLDGATLVGAVLINASVQGAHLAGAKLIGAHLEGTNFDGADLSGANLTHAVVAFAKGTYTVQVLTGDGTQTTQSVPYTYAATNLPASTTDATTICPIGYPGPCDTQQSLTVDTTNRPAQPPCVPPPNSFCSHRP